MLTRFNKSGGVKWVFVVTFVTTHSLLAAHSGDVPSWLCRNGIDEKPKYKILMKKRLTLLSLLLLFTMTAMAQTLVDGIYYYLYESENTAEVTLKTDGTKYSGDIVIPASISVDGVDYSVTLIGNSAFSYCYDLKSIEIPNSVTAIGDDAFCDCDGLTSIEIPNSVTEIGGAVFYNCSGLTSIVVEEGISYYDSRENCNAIIETSSNTLIAGCQNTVIPTSVTSIGYGAFLDCPNLTSIDIPTSVTSIGESAFASCSNLTSIEIPNSVTEIGEWAFFVCSGLTSIEIPNSVTYIGEYAFCHCSGLTSITMQRATPPTVGDELFAECSRLTTIYVPVGASEAYNVAPWNEYNIVEREVAGIESVTLEEWPADVYDLNGRMVKAQAENLDELPKGVYIVNGKKFVK